MKSAVRKSNRHQFMGLMGIFIIGFALSIPNTFAEKTKKIEDHLFSMRSGLDPIPLISLMVALKYKPRDMIINFHEFGKKNDAIDIFSIISFEKVHDLALPYSNIVVF